MQVALAVLAPVSLFVVLCWSATELVLNAFGANADLVPDASYYAMVLMLCVPVRVMFSQVTSFFAAQKMLRPGAVCSTFAMIFNLLLGLPLVLGFPIPGWDGLGFRACPWITTGLEYAQIALVMYIYVYRLRMHEACWPGWSSEHVTWPRVKIFLEQYIPSSLSLGSDFWRVAVIGMVADSLGDIDLAVWNASYRICWIMLTFLGSLSGAMGILLGQALGAGKVQESQRIASAGLIVSTALAGILSLSVAAMPRVFGSLFSSDPELLDVFESARWPMAAFVFFMNMGTMMESIPSAAGRMKTGFYAGIIGSWVGQVPGVLICTKLWRNDIVGLYVGVSFGYALLVAILGAVILTMNWSKVANEARERSEVSSVEMETGEQNDGKSVSLQPMREEDK